MSVVRAQRLEDVLEGGLPKAMLVGTTARGSLERDLVLYGREHGIPSIAVLDERYGWRQRFSDFEGQLRFVPDLVTVMDEECAKAAIEEGIPADKIRVTGSPILSYLAHQQETVWDRVLAPVYSMPPGRRLVTLVSETFARDNGSSPGQRGLLGAFLGFTEETVREDIIQVLREIGLPVVLLERLHPSDESEVQEARIDGTVFWKQIQGGDLWPLLLQSDVVVGMKSMALLEAALLGCRVASYQPGLIGENKCAAVRFRLAARLDTRTELKAWLASQLSAEIPRVSPPQDLPFVRRNAAAEVAGLVLGLMGRG
jgi:hypothetical protein